MLTGAGPVRLDRGARARVSVAGQDATLEVVVGRATLIGPGGESIVEAGEGIDLPHRRRRRGAIPRLGRPGDRGDRTPAERATNTKRRRRRAADTKTPTPTPIADARTGDDGTRAIAAGPDDAPAPRADAGRADVTFNAGESPVLHNDRLPLNVRLRFPGVCPGEGRVELGALPARRRCA